jgi:hypothetical protein
MQNAGLWVAALAVAMVWFGSGRAALVVGVVAAFLLLAHTQ